MRKLAVAACLVTSSVICGDVEEQKKTFTLASYPSWEEIQELRRYDQDFIMMEDGTQYKGKLSSLPPIEYPFSSLPFESNEVALIMPMENQPGKIQYIMNDGESYVGTLSSQPFHFVTTDGKEVALESAQVKLVILKDSKPMTSSSAQEMYSVHMHNGDKLTAFIANSNISVSDGWQYYSVPAEKIAFISKEDGVFIQENGKVRKLEGVFVTQKDLALSLPQNVFPVGVDWSEVARVESLSPAETKETIQYLVKVLPEEYHTYMMPGINVAQAEADQEIAFIPPSEYSVGMSVANTEEGSALLTLLKEKAISNLVKAFLPYELMKIITAKIVEEKSPLENHSDEMIAAEDFKDLDEIAGFFGALQIALQASNVREIGDATESEEVWSVILEEQLDKQERHDMIAEHVHPGEEPQKN